MSGETADETQAVSLGEERTYVTADLTFSQADKEKWDVPIFIFLDEGNSWKVRGDRLKLDIIKGF